MPLPPLLAVTDIHERLQTIFPEGTANRNYVTREIAANTEERTRKMEDAE